MEPLIPKRNKTLLILAAVGIALANTSCSHNMMVEMAQNQARHDYLTGHGDRQTYDDKLNEIDAFSDEWQTQQKREQQSVQSEIRP